MMMTPAQLVKDDKKLKKIKAQLYKLENQRKAIEDRRERYIEERIALFQLDLFKDKK